MLRHVHKALLQGALLLGLSAALHAAVLGSIAVNPDALARTKTPERPSHVEFETIEPPQPPKPPEPPPDEPPVPPSPPPALPRVTKRKTIPELHVGAPPEAPAPVETPPAEPPPEQEPKPAETPKPLPDLSARSAALSVWQPSPAPSEPRSVAEIERAASLALNARLKPVRRDTLDVRCDATDRCVYRGNALDATIKPDGTVEFREKSVEASKQYGVRPPPSTPTTLEDLQAPKQAQFSLRANLPAIEAERQRFLDQTEALRRERTEAWNKKIEQDGLRGFRGQLERIWSDSGSPAQARRRTLFALWEDTSPDELGARYRRLVVDFVRSNLPENSEDAYSAGELAALNSHRQQRDTFSPYAAR